MEKGWGGGGSVWDVPCFSSLIRVFDLGERGRGRK